MVVIAHAGHWALSLLYLLPVAAIVAVTRYLSWREDRDDPPAGPGDEPR